MSFNPTVQPRGDSASLNPASVLGQGWKRGLSEFSVPLPPHFWPELSYTQPFLVRRVQQKCWLGDEVLLLQKKVRKTADGSICFTDGDAGLWTRRTPSKTQVQGHRRALRSVGLTH